jgi:hypothetical protein
MLNESLMLLTCRSVSDMSEITAWSLLSPIRFFDCAAVSQHLLSETTGPLFHPSLSAWPWDINRSRVVCIMLLTQLLFHTGWQ